MTTETALSLTAAILIVRATAYKVSTSEVACYVNALSDIAACATTDEAWAKAKAFSPRANGGGFSSAFNAARSIAIGHIAYAELETTVPGGYAATSPADKWQRVRRMAYSEVKEAAASLADEARRCGVAV